MTGAEQAVLGICGWKNSGKTTLIEKLIPLFTARGLRVAVVKHDLHDMEVDRPGKDSDRFFKAGADVLLQGPREAMIRRRPLPSVDLVDLLTPFLSSYDLILVEGHKSTPLPKVWLGETGPPEGVKEVLLELSPEEDRVGPVLSLVKKRLERMPEPLGCILMGGRSSRMGTPKHLLEIQGETWLERTVRLLERATKQVVLAGHGTLPRALKEMVCLPDVPDAKGPIAGILAAMRWNPHVSWIVTACDMPLLSGEALTWLLSERKPGVWVVMPSLPPVQPLLACYDFRARPLLESAVGRGDFSPLCLLEHEKTVTPEPPQAIREAWMNVNSLEDLQ